MKKQKSYGARALLVPYRWNAIVLVHTTLRLHPRKWSIINEIGGMETFGEKEYQDVAEEILMLCKHEHQSLNASAF